MSTKFLDNIDFKKVNALLEGFNQSTGFVTAILDLDGNVLCKSGWRQICTEFHRKNPKAASNCVISDTELANKMRMGKKYHFYKCMNGLIDVAVPIIIKGQHVANLFSGQFFFEEPDIDFFINQARAFGFDENSYIEALRKVPVVSKDEVEIKMNFLLSITQMITELTFEKYEQIELNEARKKSESALRASEARYRNLFHDNYSVQIIIDSESGQIFDANSAACHFYGLTLSELKSKKLWDINPSEIHFILEKLKQTYECGTNMVFTKHIRYDGEIRDVEVFSGRTEIEERKLVHAIVHDITERKKAERNLIESEKRFRLFFENAPDSIFVQTDYRIAYANPKTVELFGAASEDELITAYIPDLFSEQHIDEVKERIHILNDLKLPVPLKEETIIRRDGTTIDVEVSSVPFNFNGLDGSLVYMRDITERREYERNKDELEMQLRQRQKLESIGTLAGGVAHEINNPVNGIINYAQLIIDDADSDHLKVYSNEIIHEGKRVAEIVKNLLSFARQEKQSHSPAQISDIINQTISLIRTVIRHDQITLDMNIPEGLPSIKCRSQQIQQVIMNLITNARDALNAKYDGFHEDKRIILNCGMFERDGRRWLKVIIEDHGTGIPDDIIDKVFDPFFTTKPREKGTGLGLSISHGIVEDHHGELYFETAVGKFTRSILELPIDNGWSI